MGTIKMVDEEPAPLKPVEPVKEPEPEAKVKEPEAKVKETKVKEPEAKETKEAKTKAGSMTLVEPDQLTLIEDEAHPLYDPRVKLPLDEGMVRNIMAYGVKLPVIVRKNGSFLEVVDGRQRVKNAIEANRRLAKEGKEEMKIRIISERGTDDEMFGVLISTNENRQGDSPMTRAKKAAKFLAMGKTEAEVAVAFGMTNSETKQLLGLLECATPVQKAVEAGLSVSAAYKLSKLPREEQVEALEAVKAGGGKTTVAKVRKAVAAKQGNHGPTPPTKKEIGKLVERLKNVDLDDKELTKGLATVQHTLEWVVTGRSKDIKEIISMLTSIEKTAEENEEAEIAEAAAKKAEEKAAKKK